MFSTVSQVLGFFPMFNAEAPFALSLPALSALYQEDLCVHACVYLYRSLKILTSKFDMKRQFIFFIEQITILPHFKNLSFLLYSDN